MNEKFYLGEEIILILPGKQDIRKITRITPQGFLGIEEYPYLFDKNGIVRKKTRNARIEKIIDKKVDYLAATDQAAKFMLSLQN